MSAPYNHDPVSALAEEDATGETAEIFRDIREVMQIPLVTSIWRTLASIENGLESVWEAARPIYLSKQPDAILEKLIHHFEFPLPSAAPSDIWKRTQIDLGDRFTIRATIEAYTRSNSLNLIALTGLMRPAASERSVYPAPPDPNSWPSLPKLLGKTDIQAADWKLLEEITPIGTVLPDSGMPTLWRHLIHWPGLIREIIEAYLPLHNDGTLPQAVDNLRVFVESEAPAIAPYRNSTNAIPEPARTMVQNYIGKPPSVSRMSTFGHSVHQWLVNN